MQGNRRTRFRSCWPATWCSTSPIPTTGCRVSRRRCAPPMSRSATSRCRTRARSRAAGDVPAPGAPTRTPRRARARRFRRRVARRQSHRRLRRRRHRRHDRRLDARVSITRARARTRGRARAAYPGAGAGASPCSATTAWARRPWATDTRAGCAYVRVDTADGAPIAPAALLVHRAGVSLARCSDDIALRAPAPDCVIVALHKGIVHTPARLAPYERPMAHAAIDAGADIVLGHHAHIVRGIELYRGKPIFHGLGNGCVVTRALSPPRIIRHARPGRGGAASCSASSPIPRIPGALSSAGRQRDAGHRGRHEDGSLRAGFVPVHVEPPGRPVVANSAQAQRIAAYLQEITARAGLPPIRLDGEGGRMDAPVSKPPDRPMPAARSGAGRWRGPAHGDGSRNPRGRWDGTCGCPCSARSKSSRPPSLGRV